MPTTLKFAILAIVLVGDIIAGGLVTVRLLGRGQAAQAAIVVAGLAIGWITLAVILFAVM